jgi:hypothetical protein
MKIVSAQWTPKHNILFINCDCGVSIPHRADRWVVRCHGCGAQGHLGQLREEYLQEFKDK